jgi:hypothetical protein
VLFGRKKIHFLEILVFWQFVFTILFGSGDVLGAFSGAVGVVFDYPYGF